MTRPSITKKEKKIQLVQNRSTSKKIVNNTTKETRQLQNDLISDANRPDGNQHVTYKNRPFAGPSHEKLSSFLEQQSIDIDEDTNDYYQIIHNSFLLELIKQSICISCNSIWNGNMSVSKREGLYCSLVFTCQCSNAIKINTSKQCPKTSKRDINIRSVIGKFIVSIVIHKLMEYLAAYFVGIGHQGLSKLCGVLNVPPPIDSDHFSRTITHIFPMFESHKLNSMKNAIEEACHESNKRQLTVSGDGTCQKRGFSSLHGVVDIMSSCSNAKVLDLERLSKNCSICTGALSIKHSDPAKYSDIKNKHTCERNHTGSSGSMETVGMHRLFSRSERMYNVQYTNYIGDGDSKVFSKLTSDPPYEDASIRKIEDVNHFSKKMFNRLQKLAEDLKKTKIDGKLGIGGKGRMTKQMMINFKQYYRQAIVRNKTNLHEMVNSVWAIWKHKASSNKEPHHEWCSTKYCGYLRSLEKDEEYDHNQHCLPLGVMKAIRPVFDELAHPDTLMKVINGGSQNGNESFHAVLWNLAPKYRYATGIVIDLCAAMAVLCYNDGNQAIIPAITDITGGGGGYYTKVALRRVDEQRLYYEHKKKRKKEEKTKHTKEKFDSLQVDRMSLGIIDDDTLDDSYVSGAY
ncbi:unnamed protein product [Adineta steineri]|uniref:Mutator-like transposase domain-containing protein n=1 Tax=Adineta steineri TaxID=433720 RepID=A0A815HAM7_9BILA|nr:unnamed protein product [Adineta steineri]